MVQKALASTKGGRYNWTRCSPAQTTGGTRTHIFQIERAGGAYAAKPNPLRRILLNFLTSMSASMVAPVNQRISVPIDDPNADTEWNDILRKKGIIPEKPPSLDPLVEEAILRARRLEHESRLEGKDVDELNELEDDEDGEVLEQYRQKRMAELTSLQKKAEHGSVYMISKPDYQRDVTEASSAGPVFLSLTSSLGPNVESNVLSKLWKEAAQEYGEVKFCEMRASQAIENYPEKNCPTILVYRNGDLIKQVVTLATIGGVHVSRVDLDDILVEVGAVTENDVRVVKRRREAEDMREQRLLLGVSDGENGKATANNPPDDDWY